MRRLLLILVLAGCAASPWARYPVESGVHRVTCDQLAWRIAAHPDLPAPAGVVVPMCDGEPLPVTVTTPIVEVPQCR